MNKINIALLAGGDSSEREISLQSAARVAASLDTAKYDVYLVDVHGVSWKYTSNDGTEIQVDKNDFSLTIDDRKVSFDYALILIHGTPGEDGKMQGYLDMMGVSYSSCGMTSTVVTFDKLLCKMAVREGGVNLARHIYIKRGDSVEPEKLAAGLGLPLIIKPTASGSSFGVTKVNDLSEIPNAIESARKESADVLAEEFIAGTEVSCGILITRNKEYVLPVTEIVSKKDFFDYEAKYTPGFSEEITPARIDEKTLAVVNEMTRNVYKACGCRGIVRVDFIIKDGMPYFIEVNSVPGMSGGSIVPKQAAVAGLTLGGLYDTVIEDTYIPRR